MTAAYKIFRFSILKNSCCDVIVKMKMFPFAKLFIEIIDNSQSKRVRDLKLIPDLEHRLRIKISVFTKENILRCFLLQNDGRAALSIFNQKYSPAGQTSRPNWTNLNGLYSGGGFLGKKQFFTCGTLTTKNVKLVQFWFPWSRRGSPCSTESLWLSLL